MKDGQTEKKKIRMTVLHVLAVICLMLSLKGITYLVEESGNSVFMLFQEAETPVKTPLPSSSAGLYTDTETGKAKEETGTTAPEKNVVSYQDEDFREEFYTQLKDAIAYAWYAYAFEDRNGEIDLNKVVVHGVNANEESVQYTIRDLIAFSERYGTYDTGQKTAEGDSFAVSYWNDLIGVQWCAFDLTFGPEYTPGMPVAYENRLVGITNVFDQQMARYHTLKEKFTSQDNGLFFQIAYHIGTNPDPVVITNHQEELDYKQLDMYFDLQMPNADVETNLPGYSVYDLPDLTGTADTYKLSLQPVYSVTAGWADSKAALTEAMRAAQTSAAAEETEKADPETDEANDAQKESARQREESLRAALESLQASVKAQQNREMTPNEREFYQKAMIFLLVLFVLSLVLAVMTLIWMLFHTGKVIRDGKERFVVGGADKWYLEVVLLLSAAVLMFWNHLPFDRPADAVIGNYFILLTVGLSMIRRIRAGKLAEYSLFPAAAKVMKQAFRVCLEYQKPVVKTAAGFVGWTAANLVLNWLFWSGLSVWKINGDKLYQVVMAAVLLFILYGMVLFLFLIRSAHRQRIIDGVEAVSAGRLEHKIELDHLSGEDRKLADSINHIGDGLLAAVETATKSERMKTELITNVSHDIKTPLTSIINYVDLLKRENIQDQKIGNYIRVLDQKSQRLKNLIEDLVEASKASSGNVVLELERIDFSELVRQIDGEFQARYEEAGLLKVTTIPDAKIYVQADGRRMWRILENLYQNALKYAMKETRVYISVIPYQDTVSFVMKNVSASPLNFDAQELTERFIRGDVARTTEGSGLGLSIAKSLTHLHNGDFQVYLDGDLFKVSVTFQTEK